MMTLLLFTLGLAALLLGAELMVRGASKLALAMGLSPLIIGMTVVAIGTSAPEFAIGIDGALRGQTDLALGNVVGSNISNVLLILGLIALISPLVVARQLVRLDVPIMIAVSLVCFVLALDGTISRFEGIGMLLAGMAYIVFLIWQGRRESRAAGVTEAAVSDNAAPTPASVPHRVWLQLLLIGAGLALLVWGANTLVASASVLARSWGMSEMVIGLTIIAVGTSLPEVATGILAAMRGQGELAVGNIVGSGIFNLLLVLGLTAAVAADGVPVSQAVLRFDFPVMIAVAIACLPIFFTGYNIARWEGAVFIGYYLAYASYLLMAANHHDALDEFGLAMRWVVMPLTAITLAVSVGRTLRARARRR